jgi:hypothetical protein
VAERKSALPLLAAFICVAASRGLRWRSKPTLPSSS